MCYLKIINLFSKNNACILNKVNCPRKYTFTWIAYGGDCRENELEPEPEPEPEIKMDIEISVGQAVFK